MFFSVLIGTYRWNEIESRVALTIAYSPQASYLIEIKMTLTYKRKYRIFTAIENYLNK